MHLYKPKVLIIGHMEESDFLSPTTALKQQDQWTVIVRPDLVGSDLAQVVSEINPDILGVQRSKITPDVLNASKNLKLVVSLGSGIDNIDLMYARKKGIKITRCPGANAYAVTELIFGLLINLDRQIPQHHQNVRQGTFDSMAYGMPIGLHGRTIGVLGLGHVGEDVARAGMAFGMKVAVWSRNPQRLSRLAFVRDEDRHSGPLEQSHIKIAEQCNVICVCLAETEGTIGICNREFFDAMQPDTIFINTSRWRLVDEAALLDALDSDRNIRAGLDVFDHSGDSRLRNHPNVVATPHIGAKTQSAKTNTAMHFCQIANTFAQTGSVPEEVLLPDG